MAPLASPLLIPVFGEGDREAGLRGTLRRGGPLSHIEGGLLYMREGLLPLQAFPCGLSSRVAGLLT